MTKLQTYLTITTMREFQNAIMGCAQDHDLYKLGRKLAELVLRTEFAIAEGMLQDERGKTIDVGLPFVMFSDALPHCAKAIRAKGAPMELDLADILDCKCVSTCL